MSNQREAFEKWWAATTALDVDVAEGRAAWAGYQFALSSAPSAEPVAWMADCDFFYANEDRPDNAKPLYTTPPNLSAAVAAAREQDARVCDELANNPENGTEYQNGAEWAGNRIRAQQDPDGLAALEELCMKVAIATWYASPDDNPEAACRAIVQSVLKGE